MRITAVTLILAAAGGLPGLAAAQDLPLPERIGEPRATPKAVVRKTAPPDGKYNLDVGFGMVLPPGSEPFDGGISLKLFFAGRVKEALQIEGGLSYADFDSRAADQTTGGVLTLSVGLRYDTPLVGEWLLGFARAAAHYSFSHTYFSRSEATDTGGRASGAGFLLGGGLRFRLFQERKTGRQFFLGLEFNSLWIFQTAVSGAGATVLNSISLPMGVRW